MYKIKVLKDIRGEKFYPLTNVNAVIDDDGIPLSYRLRHISGGTGDLSAYYTKTQTDDRIDTRIDAASLWESGTGNLSAMLKDAENTASGDNSVAMGTGNTASGDNSFVAGEASVAEGTASHAEGYSTSAMGYDSHTEGYYTTATNSNEHAEGFYNESHSGSTDAERTLHSVGFGTEEERKNAFEVMRNGDIYIYKDDARTNLQTALDGGLDGDPITDDSLLVFTDASGYTINENSYSGDVYFENITISAMTFGISDDAPDEEFEKFVSATNITFGNVNTSGITNMEFMFLYCHGLTSLDLSNFDTSKVTNMGGMFGCCEALTSLDLSNFDTSKVTGMSAMFSYCEALTSLDVSNFDTSKVTSMYSMFNGCEALTSLDVSNFDTSSVTDMGGMFNGCSAVTSFVVSSAFFNTSLASIPFNGLTAWVNVAEITAMLNALPTTATTRTLRLSSNTKAAMTAEMTAIATDKGWTIA